VCIIVSIIVSIIVIHVTYTGHLPEVDFSTGTLRVCSAPKAVEPSRQQAMKQENMLPKGTAGVSYK
jgi:hypothetical protein